MHSTYCRCAVPPRLFIAAGEFEILRLLVVAPRSSCRLHLLTCMLEILQIHGTVTRRAGTEATQKNSDHLEVTDTLTCIMPCDTSQFCKARKTIDFEWLGVRTAQRSMVLFWAC